MTKQEFLQRLRWLLADVTQEEREEALRYYEEYFDEAGPEEEQTILNELGSPEKVAAIIKANVPGSRIPPRYQTDASAQQAGAGAAQYSAPPRYQTAAPGAHSDNRTLLWVVIVIAAIVLSPLWLSILGTVFGLLLAVVLTGAGLAFGGAAAIVAGAVVVVKGLLSFGTGVGTALLVAGLGVLDIALGFAMVGIGLALCMLLGWLWKMLVRGWHWAKEQLTRNRARGNEQ